MVNAFQGNRACADVLWVFVVESHLQFSVYGLYYICKMVLMFNLAVLF